VTGEKVSALNRVVSAIGGFVVGGLGSGVVGAALGYKEMLTTLIPAVTLNIVILALGVWNPAVLLPILIAGGWAQGIWRITRVSEKIKQEVGRRYVEHLRMTTSERANQLADDVATLIVELEATVDAALGKHIQGLRDQVESVLAQKRQGQAQVDKAVRDLKLAREQVEVIDSKLDELVHEIALT
jgi:hypothetical protein